MGIEENKKFGFKYFLNFLPVQMTGWEVMKNQKRVLIMEMRYIMYSANLKSVVKWTVVTKKKAID